MSSRYECNYTDIVFSKSMGDTLPLVLIFQAPVIVSDKDQCIYVGYFTTVLDSKSCGVNDGAMIIKH